MPAITDDLEMLERADALARFVTGAAMAVAYTRGLDENDCVGCFPASA
jgi:hypothetical protein